MEARILGYPILRDFADYSLFRFKIRLLVSVYREAQIGLRAHSARISFLSVRKLIYTSDILYRIFMNRDNGNLYQTLPTRYTYGLQGSFKILISIEATKSYVVKFGTGS
jgi:hypothetical protein